MNLTKLKGIIPENVLNELPSVMKNFNCNTILRVCHLLSQCAHESENFTAVKENLNYSASALKATFPTHFPGNLNESYAHNPEKIADRAYANRMGNGDEASGDGYKYCGRGYIELTGKVNYAAFGKFINEDLLTNPGLVATKYPLMSAAFFFNTNNLWSICDLGCDLITIKKLTLKINGAYNGLDDRINLFNKYYNLLK